MLSVKVNSIPKDNNLQVEKFWGWAGLARMCLTWLTERKMKKQFILSLFLLSRLVAMAENPTDTTHVVKLNEVVVNSLKETSPQQTPLSSTVLNPKSINSFQITNVRDLSGLVPNFYIPDYGSAMSSTSYIRGIGTRNSGQSMGLYVDNVPYFEKSTFDFDFYEFFMNKIPNRN